MGTPGYMSPEVASLGQDGRLPAASASWNGRLVYRTGGSGGSIQQLTWFDRQGHVTGTISEPGDYIDAVLSPGGMCVALPQSDQRDAAVIWLVEVERGIFTRFTSDPTIDRYPV